MHAVRTIAVINQKGGVGKTTTVANLGAALAVRGHHTCLVDLDPQSHLTLHLGLEPDADHAGTYDLLTDEATLSEAAHQVGHNLAVVPADINLAAAEVELVSVPDRQRILARKLADGSGLYDLTMIDCPPSLGLLTLNALAAADEVFIPLQPHFLALQGLGKLLQTVSLVQQQINPSLVVGGVILCMYETSTRLAGEVVSDLKAFFEQARDQQVPWSNARIFDSLIRRNVKLAECPSHGQTIFTYEPSSIGAADYTALADEVAQWLDEPQVGRPAKVRRKPAAGQYVPGQEPDEATGAASSGTKATRED